MAYTLDSFVTELKAYKESQSNLDGLDYTAVNDLALAKQAIAGAFDAGASTNAAVRDMVESRKLVEYNGYTIYYVPSAEELLNRLAAAAVYEKMIPKGFEQHFRDASEVSQGTLDKWVPALGVGADAKKAWNNVAKKIKDKMLERKRASGAPGVGSVTLFSVGEAPHLLAIPGAPAGTVRVTPGVAMPVGAWTVGKVSANRGSWGMMGGSVSSHAPLYPSLVMNGGAHPFATFSGGDGVKAVAHIKTSIDAMENQFQLNSGQALGATLGTTAPSVYVNQVKNDIDALEKAVNELRSANLALAQAPLAAGVQPDFQALVARGDEISKKAAKVSKGWDRLSQIHEALQQLVAKSEKVKLSGGLHNALKH